MNEELLARTEFVIEDIGFILRPTNTTVGKKAYLLMIKPEDKIKFSELATKEGITEDELILNVLLSIRRAYKEMEIELASKHFNN